MTTDPKNTEFDLEDELLATLFELCSPEQRARGNTPRQALEKLSPDERRELLSRAALLHANGPKLPR